jgi:uncharacterized protein
MVSRDSIREFAQRVARAYGPERIVLFGSYAYGTPTEDSDVDLLVAMPHEGSSAAKATEIRLRERPGFPTDPLVRSPDTLRQRADMHDFFILEIMERGVTLFEADHSRVG